MLVLFQSENVQVLVPGLTLVPFHIEHILKIFSVVFDHNDKMNCVSCFKIQKYILELFTADEITFIQLGKGCFI